MSTPSSPDTAVRPTRPPAPQNIGNMQQTRSPHPQVSQASTIAGPPNMRPQIQIPTSNGPIRGEYLLIVNPQRQPGVQGFRYPLYPIARQPMLAPTGATILQRPTLIRGIPPQPGMGIQHAVIPTSQPFSIAGIPTAMATNQTPNLIHSQPGSNVASIASRMTPHDALNKGVHFLNKLLTEIHIQSQKTAIQNLIQELIDNKKTPEQFASKLQSELGSQPQPQLIPFLELALPTLRHSLVTGATQLPGIKPPDMKTLPPVIQHMGHPIDNRIVISPAAASASTSSDNSTSGPFIMANASATISTPPIAPGTPMTPGSVATTTTTPTTTTSTAKKPKKAPLPPGQKSQYALKKEAREARKREKELLNSQAIKQEKTEEKTDTTDTLQQSTEKSPTKPKVDKARKQEKQKKQEKQLENLSSTLRDDDDVNDVAAMGGVNLAEESQKIMASGAELVGTQIRSCKDEPFFDRKVLASRVSKITLNNNLEEPSEDVVALISHALQERLKDIVERLGVLAEHRAENIKLNSKYEISNDIKGQMKFLAELDRIEKRRYEEQERELLIRVAKSRSKVEDPEQQKLRQKAKDMQRAEQEEVRQREANMTALLAIGPRKKFKTGSEVSMSSFSHQSNTSSGLRESRPNIELRQDAIRRIKRVNLRDLQVLFELDRIHLDRLIKIAAQ